MNTFLPQLKHFQSNLNFKGKISWFFIFSAKQTPFQISFFSDNWENTAEIAAAILEAGQTRSGFQLTYVQSSTNC